MDYKGDVEGTVSMVNSLARNVRAIMSRITFGTDHLDEPGSLHTLDKQLTSDLYSDFVAEHVTNKRPIKTSPPHSGRHGPEGNTGSTSAAVLNRLGCMRTVKEQKVPSGKPAFVNTRYEDSDSTDENMYKREDPLVCQHVFDSYKNRKGYDTHVRKILNAHTERSDSDIEGTSVCFEEKGTIDNYVNDNCAAVMEENKSRVEYKKALSAYELHRHVEPSSTQPSNYDLREGDKSLLTYKFNKSRFRHVATKASRCLFSTENRARQRDQTIHIQFTQSADSQNDNSLIIPKESENETMKEFENDLVFLSKCGNRMSTPAKTRPSALWDGDKLSFDNSYTKLNTGIQSESDFENGLSVKSENVYDNNKGYQLGPNLQTSPLLSKIYPKINKSPGFHLNSTGSSPIGIYKRDIPSRDGNQGAGARGHSGTHLSPRQFYINSLPSLTSLWNPSKYFGPKTGCSYRVPEVDPVFRMPVRRSLSFAPSDLPPEAPLASARVPTDTSNRFELSTAVNKPDTAPRFRNEDEEAVYYLITKYLNKDGDYL